MIKDVEATKKKLLGVTDLNAGLISKMTEKQLQSYIQALNVTANTYPVQKEELESAFRAMDYAMVVQWLKIIVSSLVQVSADELVRDCEKHFDLDQDIESIRHEKLRIFIEYYIPTLDIFFADVLQTLDTLEAVELQQEAQPERVLTKLLTITELDGKKLRRMEDEELESYIGKLNYFHENFHTQEQGLRGAVRIKHYVFVMQWLSAIEETLSSIYAYGLAEDCQKQIEINRDFNSIKHEKLEVFTNYFLSTLSMLAADIKQLHLPKHIQKKNTEENKNEIKIEIEIVSPGSSPDSKSILIVNKMKIFLNSIKSALNDHEHKILGVSSGVAALGYLRTSKPDLLIIDEDMQGIDSYTFTKTIRNMGHMTPIILTTSKITKEKAVKFTEAGVADFIVKPISPGDVQKKLAKHLP
jgi:CheY-like chemotaxis protein